MSFLTRKYPFKQSGHWLRESIVYGLIVWAILYFMQPFGFVTYQGNKCLVAGLFGLITFACTATYVWMTIKLIVPHVTTWRIWHQGCTTLGLIVFIAVCNFFYYSLINEYPLTLEFFLTFLYWTMIIGIILTALSTGIRYNKALKEQMNELLLNTTEEQKDITITIHDTNVRGNDLSIPINSLLYIEAQKNNISVCYIKDEKPISVELHTTLSNAIEELKEHKNILQCHRSFVINANNITSAKGNSNGYQLTLGNSTNIIPVSRSYVPLLKALIA